MNPTRAREKTSDTLAPRLSAPTVYAHVSQTQWGLGVAASVRSDRTTYVFEHAGERTFLHGTTALQEVSLPSEERQALARALLSRRTPVKKRAPTARRKQPADPSATLFERQLEIFATTFPKGFADARFVNEERSVTKRDAAIAFAREVLAKPALDEAIATGAFGDVLDRARRVVQAMHSLMLPKADQRGFERIGEVAQERFARTLRDLLHGESEYASRFDAFVGSAGSQPWTLATLFSATVHPEHHLFVKPTLNVRQASALDLHPPPLGAPTGDAYAKHLAIGNAVRSRLIDAGLAPRDLLDVYSFAWRTLTRSAQSTMP